MTEPLDIIKFKITCHCDDDEPLDKFCTDFRIFAGILEKELSIRYPEIRSLKVEVED